MVITEPIVRFWLERSLSGEVQRTHPKVLAEALIEFFATAQKISIFSPLMGRKGILGK